jgi:hypothetical protein
MFLSWATPSCGADGDRRPSAGASGAGSSGGRAGSSGTAGTGGSLAGTGSGGSSGDASPGGTGGGHTGHSDAATDALDSEAQSIDDAGSVNGCIEYTDRTSDSALRAITWDFGIVDAPERCMKVRIGQTVTFSGDFAEHPLAAGGGDTPSPIAERTTFTQAGVFGYYCTDHPEMFGAIWVVVE